MSVSSPAGAIEAGNIGQCASVRSALFRLYFERRFWRACTEVTLVFACALAVSSIIACVDHARSLPRIARIALLAPLLLTIFLFAARAALLLTKRRTLATVAREIERASGNEQNALVTFAESAESTLVSAGGSYMIARLETQARNELAKIDARIVAPRRGAALGAAALVSITLLLLALRVATPAALTRETRRILWLAQDDASMLQPRPVTSAAASADEAGSQLVVDELGVRVVPPAYSGLSVEEAPSEGPVRALTGSRIEVSLHARGAIDGATLSFNGAASTMRAIGEGHFSGAFIANASGAFEARVMTDEKRAPAPFVRAIEVYPDAPPEARITEPTGDQLLRALPAGPINVHWTARDDLGLAGVMLKYVKSRGEGDAAKFTNGEITPGNIERATGREWHSVATLDLTRLGVRAGDTLVFWVEARDRNPSANNIGRSASLAIAIAAPDAPKLNLSDLRPNEIGRFLLSERLIIIHTEKLHGERMRLTQSELIRRANDIAAEQRDFKSSFNDYINIEGAEQERPPGAVEQSAASIEERVRAAEGEQTETHNHGIPEPPAGSPNSVREMIYAIRAMWDAEDALSTGDTTKALMYEHEALTRLKRAQAAVRYVPPIAAQSKPIDLKRRYAGELTEIKTQLEKLARRSESKEAAPIRAALADAYASLGDLQRVLSAPASARASAMVRARDRARRAADRLISAPGGDQAAVIAEAAGQLRVVETELGRAETGGTGEEFAARVAKPLALLAQAAANLFAIADRRTHAAGGDMSSSLPTDDARAADYFRRLAGHGAQ